MATERPHFDVEIRVRYGETDQMGVVYHAEYLVWCEIGRTEYIRAAGLAYAEMERRGTTLAVADASLRYHAPARYDDRVRVETSLRSVGEEDEQRSKWTERQIERRRERKNRPTGGCPVGRWLSYMEARARTGGGREPPG